MNDKISLEELLNAMGKLKELVCSSVNSRNISIVFDVDGEPHAVEHVDYITEIEIYGSDGSKSSSVIPRALTTEEVQKFMCQSDSFAVSTIRKVTTERINRITINRTKEESKTDK